MAECKLAKMEETVSLFRKYSHQNTFKRYVQSMLWITDSFFIVRILKRNTSYSIVLLSKDMKNKWYLIIVVLVHSISWIARHVEVLSSLALSPHWKLSQTNLPTRKHCPVHLDKLWVPVLCASQAATKSHKTGSWSQNQISL